MELAIEIVKPSFKIIHPSEDRFHELAKLIEYCGRLSHKSEDRITENSAFSFIEKIARKLGHESIEEHASITVHFTMSRSASHQLVRHRLCAFTQESQRYCDYSHLKYENCLKVICPPMIDDVPDGLLVHAHWGENEDVEYELHSPDSFNWLSSQRFRRFAYTIIRDYATYLWEREDGVPAEDARYSLPNATKTEIVMTANVRQWRHVGRMRCDKHAQWELRGLISGAVRELARLLPCSFIDIGV